MMLDVYFEDQHYRLEVTSALLEQGQALFEKMDRDMDAGWQMGSVFVEDLSDKSRAQIAASKLVVALENQNESMIKAMSAYIVHRLPSVSAVHIDTSGQILNTEFVTREA
ncbi:MAG: hypothetical protein ACFCVA_01880 [Gammaproteobacteria bacterium]